MNNDLISQRAQLSAELHALEQAQRERESGPQREAQRAEQLRQQLAAIEQAEATARLERVIAQNAALIGVYRKAAAQLMQQLNPIIELLAKVDATALIDDCASEQEGLVQQALEIALGPAASEVDARRIAGSVVSRFQPALDCELLLKEWIVSAGNDLPRHQWRTAIALGVLGRLFELPQNYDVKQEWKTKLLQSLLFS